MNWPGIHLSLFSTYSSMNISLCLRTMHLLWGLDNLWHGLKNFHTFDGLISLVWRVGIWKLEKPMKESKRIRQKPLSGQHLVGGMSQLQFFLPSGSCDSWIYGYLLKAAVALGCLVSQIVPSTGVSRYERTRNCVRGRNKGIIKTKRTQGFLSLKPVVGDGS